MKITRAGSTLVGVFALALLSLPILGAPNLKGATQSEAISKKEARWLVGHAETPAQHLQLTEYYRQQATESLKEANKHNSMFDPQAGPSKLGWLGYIPRKHCSYWAGVLTKRAQNDEAEANVQEKLAMATSRKNVQPQGPAMPRCR